MLASALSALMARSSQSLEETARAVGITPVSLRAIVAGERLPDWPTLFTLVTRLGGLPEEFRTLWEWANGLTPSSSRSVRAALRQFHAVLRGVHLAAGLPSASTISLTQTGDEDEVLTGAADAALNGDWVPDWETTRHLVRQLGLEPDQFRPLWKDVQDALFLALDFTLRQE